MNPQPAGQFPPSEKSPEAAALLMPPPTAPPGYSAVYQPLPVVNQDYPRSARRRRFWHFFACTVVFLGAVHILAKTGLYLPRVFHWGGRAFQHTPPPECSDLVNWTTDASEPHSQYPYHAHTSFDLPMSAKEFNFLSQGAYQVGDFEIAQDLDARSDTVVVEVSVAYRRQDVFEEATVCRTHADELTWGLGIYTPHWRPPHSDHTLKFHITLHLPAAPAAHKPLKIDTLRTNLPLFVHHLPELADTVFFEVLALKSTNTPVIADSVKANYFQIHTTNGAIRGTYNTTTSLVLETTNAPITVHAGLTSGGSKAPTRAYIKSTNGHVEANIALVSNRTDAMRGLFNVEAHSTNAPVQVSIVDAPADSELNLQTSTSNSPARVQLHPTYEGTFDLKTSNWFAPEVKWSPDVEDPKGLGRRHQINIAEARRGHASGSAAWENGRENVGSVTVKSSNSPVSLTL